MKLKDTFINHTSEGEQILVDTTSSFAGVIRNNSTAAFIVECLKKETTKEQIIDAIYARYDAPKDVITKDVENVIANLLSAGALE